MKKLFFILALLVPISSVAQVDCEFTQAMCSAQTDYEQADAELNKTYQLILKKIKSNEFEEYLVSKKSIQRSLLKSQRAWLKYRDENCDAHYTLFSGGTSRNTGRLVCLSKMTTTRSQQLRELYL